MSRAVRQRIDPRREATRTALIEAAERLFFEAGVEAVSTRQIGAAIGSLNTNVVAYHFGSKDALIEAVFHHRLPAIDRRRGELLAALEASTSAPTIAGLVRAFALPLYEQTDSAGRHSFVGFIAALERSNMARARALVSDVYPMTERLTAMLSAQLPDGCTEDGNWRLRLVFSLIATALQLIDQQQGDTADQARARFDNAVAMAAAAYAAPAAATEQGFAE